METEQKTIGGYIELQIPRGTVHYPDFISLNTGRNALEYILRIRGYKVVYLPYFTCEVLLEPLRRLNINHRFYNIDKNLEPVNLPELEPEECLVYTNYFGTRQKTVRRLSKQVKNLIVDNAQAFFCEPVPGVDTFYSCRKFFGVPDGAYVYTNSNTRLNLTKDISVDRFLHLIKRIDLSIESGYSDYIRNNIELVNNEVKKMSALSHTILSGIDYQTCKQIREANFKYLHQELWSLNELAIDPETCSGPMVYPFLLNKPGLRKALIEKKILVATYWPNVLEWTTAAMAEHYLCRQLIPLPIDHRYSINDMKQIIQTLKQCL